MEQFPCRRTGVTESDIDKYVTGVRVYENHFEWLLDLDTETRGELDDAGSSVYFKKLTVTPDDEREWFRTHPQWSKFNKYAELEARIYIKNGRDWAEGLHHSLSARSGILSSSPEYTSDLRMISW